MELIKVRKEDLLTCPHCGNLLSVKKSAPVAEVKAEKKPKKKKTRREFSVDEGQRIVELRNEGKSFAEIAKILDRSMPTVYAKFKAEMAKRTLATDVVIETA